MSLNIVLYEPEIPPNTGNIARSCVAVGASLHLIRPLGFEISDKYLRRAGMDYWKKLDYKIWDTLEEFFSNHPQAGKPFPPNCYFVSTKAEQVYSSVDFPADSWFMFGPESRGLPEYLMNTAPKQSLTIPMKDGIRSLNLSNAAAILMYEYCRQHNFTFT